MNSGVVMDGAMTHGDILGAAREAYRKQEWGRAHAYFSAADKGEPLVPGDLECFAKSAYILGNDPEGAEILARAHRRFLDADETLPAIRCAFWLGFSLLIRGEAAQAGGWLARASRLLEGQDDCVEKGYLLLPEAFRHVHGGDAELAYDLFKQAADAATRFGDRDLLTFGLNGQGRALIRQGEIERGVSLLDEAMVSVMTGEVSPLTAGGIYCSVIEACSDIFDLRRAQEWTTALDKWCSTQSDPISYRGHCMLRRAEILQLHGEWSEAMKEAQLAAERFSNLPQQKAAGGAWYRIGELHRLRAEFDRARAAYKQASQLGANVQPGLALLRLMQGQPDAAKASIRGLALETSEIRPRASLLAARVEIALAANEIDEAKGGADHLLRLAQEINAPLLNAIADRANGAVLIAAGNIDGAIVTLRRCCNLFRELNAPYDEACVRALLAEACQKQKDCDTAEMELDAARRIFDRLGAAWDLSLVDESIKAWRSGPIDPLTKREAEVLKLVAAGKTNRQIATDLFISEKTVARHISNIFVKLDLSSRAAATAYAFQNQLV